MLGEKHIVFLHLQKKKEGEKKRDL